MKNIEHNSVSVSDAVRNILSLQASDEFSMRCFSNEELLEIVKNCYHIIVEEQPTDRIWGKWMQNMTRPFLHSGSLIQKTDIYMAHDKHSESLRRLFMMCHIRGLVNLLDDKTSHVQNKFKNMLGVLNDSYKSDYIRYEVADMARVLLEKVKYAPPIDLDNARNNTHDTKTKSSTICNKELSILNLSTTWIDSKTIMPYQAIVLCMLKNMQMNRLRRIDEDCYQEVFVNGLRTHFWRRVCTISKFVYRALHKETEFTQWCNLTSGRDCASSVTRYLANCKDIEFMELTPNRHIFAFQNGIYDVKNDNFTLYTDISSENEEVAIRLFDTDFDVSFNYCNWRDIPTPEFDAIFTYQGYGPDVITWAYAMLGRVLYSVSEYDNWQVGVFFKGIAGSGKSTIGNIVKHMYPANRVGTMSSNGEDKFGLSALYDKLVYVCTEVKKDFALNQGDWQSMVSGEEVSVARKHKPAINIRWSVPGVLCGNELPRWVDAAGSVVRRLVVFDFPRKVIDGDPDLEKKIKQNVCAFLCKINKAYKEIVAAHGNHDIWKKGILPKELVDSHEEMKREVDGLASFLSEGPLIMGPEQYIPIKEFKQAYKEYRDKMGIGPFKWGPDHYVNVFEENELKLDDAPRVWPKSGTIHEGPFIIGVDLEDQHGAIETNVSSISSRQTHATASDESSDELFCDIGME